MVLGVLDGNNNDSTVDTMLPTTPSELNCAVAVVSDELVALVVLVVLTLARALWIASTSTCALSAGVLPGNPRRAIRNHSFLRICHHDMNLYIGFVRTNNHLWT